MLFSHILITVCSTMQTIVTTIHIPSTSIVQESNLQPTLACHSQKEKRKQLTNLHEFHNPAMFAAILFWAQQKFRWDFFQVS